MFLSIGELPRPKRPLACILVAFPAAFLTFVAVLLGGPGDGPGGGMISIKLLGAIGVGVAIGLTFLIWALLSLGPTRRDQGR